MTPEEIAARIKELNSVPKPEPINNTERVEAFRKLGGGIIHCLPSGKRRGVTFAYRLKGGRLEIATGTQHAADSFTKKIGTKVAIENFEAGKKVVIPVERTNTSRDIHLLLKYAAY